MQYTAYLPPFFNTSSKSPQRFPATRSITTSILSFSIESVNLSSLLTTVFAPISFTKSDFDLLETAITLAPRLLAS